MSSGQWRSEILKSMNHETDAQRTQRQRQRRGFEQAAEAYDRTRSGYPEELVSEMLETASLNHGGRILEIGCGTGQLTRSLVGHGFLITAIDPAPSMVA